VGWCAAYAVHVRQFAPSCLDLAALGSRSHRSGSCSVRIGRSEAERYFSYILIRFQPSTYLRPCPRQTEGLGNTTTGYLVGWSPSPDGAG
jgi:hypothetical protein